MDGWLESSWGKVGGKGALCFLRNVTICALRKIMVETYDKSKAYYCCTPYATTSVSNRSKILKVCVHETVRVHVGSSAFVAGEKGRCTR